MKIYSYSAEETVCCTESTETQRRPAADGEAEVEPRGRTLRSAVIWGSRHSLVSTSQMRGLQVRIAGLLLKEPAGEINEQQRALPLLPANSSAQSP